jgi:hypothetical protein
VKDTDIVTVIGSTGIKFDGMEMIYICEAPQRGNSEKLASNPIKYKAKNSKHKHHEFFFHKSKTNPRNLNI